MSKNLLLLAAASVGLTACATVSSYSVKPEANLDATHGPGLTYYLPTRLVKLTANREPVDLDELTEARTSAAKGLEGAETALSTAKKAHKTAKAVLAALDAAAPNRADLEGAVAKAAAEEKVAQAARDAAEAKSQAAAKAWRDATSGGTTCTYSAKLELLPAQPDPRFRFVARPRHNILRDDTVKLGVNASGLLTSANAVAVDRTSDIIAEIAGLLQGGGFSELSDPVEGAGDTKECDEPKQLMMVFDPAPLPNEDLSGQPAAVAKVNAELKRAKFPVRVAVRSLATPVDRSPKPINQAATTRYKAREGALFYRSAAPVELVLNRLKKWDDKDATGFPADAAILLLPQAGPVNFVPLNSSAFVRTSDDVQFVDGSVTSWSSERPSEALEVVRLPVKILTSIISVPAQLFSLKVDYSSKAKSLAEAQQAQLKSQLSLQKLNACLSAAAAEGTDATQCFQSGS